MQNDIFKYIFVKKTHMKREIKFKAQRSSGKGWVYGMPTFDLKYMFNREQMDSPDNYEIDPDTVCQFITQIKGVEVYESDKVCINYGRYRLEPNGKTRTGVAMLDPKTLFFIVKIDNSQVRVPFCEISEIEVIGNIHNL